MFTYGNKTEVHALSVSHTPLLKVSTLMCTNCAAHISNMWGKERRRRRHEHKSSQGKGKDGKGDGWEMRFDRTDKKEVNSLSVWTRES